MRRMPVAVRIPRPGAIRFNPGIRQSKGLPIGAASPRAVAARRKPTAVPLTFGQRPSSNVTLPVWSMRPWESVPVYWLARRFPGSHGPSEDGVKERKVDFRLTARGRGGCRQLAARGHSDRSRRRWAGQACPDPGQHGNPGRDLRQNAGRGHDFEQDGSPGGVPGRGGSSRRYPGQDRSAGGGQDAGPAHELWQDGRQGTAQSGLGQGGRARAAQSGVGLGHGDGSTRGAQRWRPPGS
jgi:hypothetical protein